MGSNWTSELRFPTHKGLSEFHAPCKDAGLPITVSRIYRPSDSESTARYGLITVQYDTLAQALKQGYFTIPREITSSELGVQLGVSNQDITERIRRGLTNVLTHILVIPDED